MTQFRNAQSGCEPHGIVAIVAVGGEAVNLVRRDARAGAGGKNGFQGQLELGVRRLTVLEILRFANANDGNLVTKCSAAHIRVPARRPRSRAVIANPRSARPFLQGPNPISDPISGP